MELAPRSLGLGDEPNDESHEPEQLSDEQFSGQAHGGSMIVAGSDEAPPPPVRARQGDAGRPFCPRHNCLQVASGSKGKHTHYRCPVAGCQTREKRARPQMKVPATPQPCPQRTCRSPDGEQRIYLEVDPKLSNMAQLHMQCPKCGFHMKVPRPIFADALAQQRRPREDLAAR